MHQCLNINAMMVFGNIMMHFEARQVAAREHAFDVDIDYFREVQRYRDTAFGGKFANPDNPGPTRTSLEYMWKL